MLDDLVRRLHAIVDERIAVNRPATAALEAERGTVDEVISSLRLAMVRLGGSDTPVPVTYPALPVTLVAGDEVVVQRRRDGWLMVSDVLDRDPEVVESGGGGSGTQVSYPDSPSAAADYLARIKLEADSEYRAVLGLDASDRAQLLLGGGAAAGDARLVRTGSGELSFLNATTGAITLKNGTNALVDKGLLTTRGDLIRRGASDWERVAIGSARKVWTSDATDPGWSYPLPTAPQVYTTSEQSFTSLGSGTWKQTNWQIAITPAFVGQWFIFVLGASLKVSSTGSAPSMRLGIAVNASSSPGNGNEGNGSGLQCVAQAASATDWTVCGTAGAWQADTTSTRYVNLWASTAGGAGTPTITVNGNTRMTVFALPATE